jgi:murein L,D-transpeptidase YafK
MKRIRHAEVVVRIAFFTVLHRKSYVDNDEHSMVMGLGQLYYRDMIRRLLLGLFLLPHLLDAAVDEPSARLPGYVLKLPNSVKTVLIAETKSATLLRYAVDEDGLVMREQRRMSIGQKGVGKKRTGDQRTPLGIYFVMEELDTSNLHEKYGPVAFPLDYPNAWDEVNQKTGYGIWIHGVAPGSGPRPERDTDGCIALSNDQLLSLEPHLTPLQTPVIVTRAIQTLSDEEAVAIRAELLAALAVWTSSYRDGDWHRFVSLYTERFVYRGMNREEWSAYRIQTLAARPIDDFIVDDILLIADPEDQGLYLSRFRQLVTEDGRNIATTKRLYWRKLPDGNLKIVAEDNG